MSNADLNNELNNSKKTFSRRLLRFGIPVFTAAALTVTVYSVKHETYAAGVVTVHVYTNEHEDKTYHEDDTTDEYGKFTEPAVEKLGYELEGWFLNENFSGDPIDFTTHEFLSESNIYAQWSPEQYDLDYVLNGGHYEDDDVTNPAAYTIESDTITLVDLVRDGYTFSGWYDNPEFNGEPVTVINAGSTGDMTLYAAWTPVNNTGSSDSSSTSDSSVKTGDSNNVIVYGCLAAAAGGVALAIGLKKKSAK